MLYIHALNHLTYKTADLESIYLVREIKQKAGFPLSEEKIHDHFSTLFISNTDLNGLSQALELTEPTIQELKTLLAQNSSIYEPVNLQRAIQMLKETSYALKNNLEYASEISSWQDSFSGEITPLLNKIPKIKSNEEKEAYDRQLNKVFQRILRNEKFLFNANDIINEACLNHICGLDEGLGKGFLFHITLEEEIRKSNFEAIKERFPKESLEKAETIRKNVELIKHGIERAYKINQRMIQWAVILYAYVKWLLSHPS